MKKALSLIVVLLASFATYIYSFTIIVLGDIYTSYPGQDNITVLIATLPAVVMMVSAFASTVLLVKCNRKMLVAGSLIISLVAGLLISYVKLPIGAIVALSALMGIPAGIVAAANSSLLPVIAPNSLKDKVMGWHQASLMLGQTVFALVCGLLAKGGNWSGGFRTVYILIPVIILTILFYPDVSVENNAKDENATVPMAEDKINASKRMPTFVILLLATYFFGCIFWNAWYLNNSDFIINDVQLGDSVLVGAVNSACTAVSMVGCLLVSYWMRGLKSWALTLSMILDGACIVLPTIVPSITSCYIAACGSQLFVMMSIATIQTYIGLGVRGKKLTTAMSLVQCFEGSGVFLCGYIIPFISKGFIPSAGTNMRVGGIIVIILGIATCTFMKTAHKAVFRTK